MPSPTPDVAAAVRAVALSSASDALAPGLADPVHDAQRCFRALLQALSEPGAPVALPVLTAPGVPLAPALASVLLTLLDGDTRVALDAGSAATQWLRFHTSAPTSTVEEADFVVVTDPARRPALSALASGSDESPERGATLLMALPALDGGVPTRWRGPGICGERAVALPLPPAFWHEWRASQASFPRGVDVLFIGPDAVIGLPRSTAVALDAPAVTGA